ncbi:MAG: hypothetical protein WC943_15380 [Elusimicrobiota bacterium]|jgi:hypothetical protein
MKALISDRENQSPEVKAALRRSNLHSYRFLYETLINGREEHLATCNKPNCQECADAKVLIPNYRAEMRRDLERIASE